jgi:hypothetical protein
MIQRMKIEVEISRRRVMLEEAENYMKKLNSK